MSTNNNNTTTNQMKRGEDRTMKKYTNGNRNGNSMDTESNTNSNTTGSTNISKVGKEKRDSNANTNNHCLVCYNDFTTTRNGKNSNNNNNNNNVNNNSNSNSSIVVLLPCDHNEICSLCHLRIRYLHSDHRCPICKQDNEQIICEYYYKTRFKLKQLLQNQNQQQDEESKVNYDDQDNDNDNNDDDENGVVTTTTTTTKSKSNNNYSNSIVSTRRFDDYTIWDNNHLGTEYTYCNGQYYNNVGMFFPNEYYTNIILPILGYHCTIPTCTFTGIISSVTDIENNTTSTSNAIDTSTNSTTNTAIVATTGTSSSTTTNTVLLQLLQDHIRVDHKLSLCNLCVDNHRDFIARLPRYSVSGLKKHLTIGDGKSFKGHPVCQFCTPTRFYDITALHVHLQREHYKCHICEQYDNIPNQYYNNYQSLEQHFNKQHYLCLHPQCLMTRFIVFANEFDFRYHEKTVHNINIPSNHVDSKIKVEFRVRRTSGTSTSSYNNNNQNNNNRYGTSINENDFNFGLDGEAFTNSTSSTQNQQYSNNNQNYNYNNYNNNDPTTWTLPMGDDTAASNNNSQRRNGNSGGGSGSNAVTLHPQHVQRTEELRRQAETIRLEHTRATAFPSLSEANALSTNTGSSTNLPALSTNSNTNNAISSTEDTDTGTDNTTGATATNTSTSTRLMIGDWSSTAHTSNVLARHSSSRRTGAVNDTDFPSLGIGFQESTSSASAIGNTGTSSIKPKKKQPASASTGSGWAIAASSKPNRYVNGSTIQQQQLQSKPVSTIPISTAYTTTLSPLTNSRNIRTTSSTTTTNIVQQPVINSMSDFPSLAGTGTSTRNGTPSGIPRYEAAQELGKKLASNNVNTTAHSSATGAIATRFSTAPPPPTALNHFPSLPTPAAGTNIKKAGLINALAPKKPPPPIQDFKMLTTSSKVASAVATTTKSATSVQQGSTISIDEMKRIMGTTQYKTLKRYTSEFVANDITSINFIEACATLFNTGYNDINFWKIIPYLIDSCPNTPLPLSKSKMSAHQYLSQILQQNTSAQIAQENAAIALSSSTSASVSAKPIQQKQMKNSNLSKVAAAPSSTSWNTNGSNNKKKW